MLNIRNIYLIYQNQLCVINKPITLKKKGLKTMQPEDSKLMFTHNYVKEVSDKKMFTFLNTKNRPTTIDLNKISYYTMSTYIDHSNKHSRHSVFLVVDSVLLTLQFNDENGASKTIEMLDCIFTPDSSISTGTSGVGSPCPIKTNYYERRNEESNPV